MSEDEEWVKTAMIDDLMVVELLMRLNQSQHPPPPPSGEIKQLKWSVRQRRSKPKPATGASPTTPLSWSGGGGTSLSGGCGDREESSHSPPLPKLANHKRSKVCTCKICYTYRLKYILYILYRRSITFPANGVIRRRSIFWVFLSSSEAAVIFKCV